MAVNRVDARGLWKMVFQNISVCVAYSPHFCGGLLRGTTVLGPSFDRQTDRGVMDCSNPESEDPSAARSEDTANSSSGLPGP